MSSAAPAASANLARHLAQRAAESPARAALKIPRDRTRAGDIDYLTLSFAELAHEVDAWAARFTGAGVQRGTRTLVMVRQGLPLIAGVFALFQIGAVPVVIDPGMGLKNFLAAVAHTRPTALVGIPLAQLLSRVCRRSFATVTARIAAPSALTARLAPAVSSRSAPGGVSLPPAGARLVHLSPADPAAVLFTSGSTGAPKGVCYTHGMLGAQVDLVRAAYGIEPGEIDLPLLPVFALFNPALGMTTIVPELDPRRPARIAAAAAVRAIQQEQVTNSFGSPTLWRKLADHCLAHGLTLPSLRRVLCAGAPVPASLWADAPRLLPRGKLHSPYGATEALPVASIAHDELLALGDLTGRGACVGRPLPENQVAILPLHDGPWSTFPVDTLPSGAIGEIVVAGPSVTHYYDGLPEATARAKIGDAAAAGGLWHRMGDAGYRDADGRLWFCGRIVERVVRADGRELHTEPFEQVFRGHPHVARCALVGLGPCGGPQEPVLVIERRPAQGLPPLTDAALTRELLALAAVYPLTRDLRHVLFHPRFPVDVRHNAKIHRLTLARWAAARLRP